MSNQQGTKHRPRTPGVKRTRQELELWSVYRLTVDEYESMLSKGCAICGSTENLCIDHDHKCCPRVNPVTGKRSHKTCGTCIRGVLCRRHNLAEGHLNSDPAEVQRLLDYLTQ